MSKFRLPIAVLCVLTSLLCAVWAKPKALTKKQQEDKDWCDTVYNVCAENCNQSFSSPGWTSYYDSCFKDCSDNWYACMKKAGVPTIKALPPAHLPPNVPTAQPLQPTSSPGSTPKRLQPQGTLTQASPSATPKRLVRQPQGTLTQASPTASPNKILSATPKKLQPQGTLTQASPSATPRKRHHDQEKKGDK
jgi:hypothetical protein